MYYSVADTTNIRSITCFDFRVNVLIPLEEKTGLNKEKCYSGLISFFFIYLFTISNFVPTFSTRFHFLSHSLRKFSLFAPKYSAGLWVSFLMDL